MPDPDLSRLMAEMTQAKQHAGSVLQSLLAARRECESQLDREHRPDLMKLVTGRSSLEEACLATQRLIEGFDRVIQEAGDRADRAAANAPAPAVSGDDSAEAPLSLLTLSRGWNLRPRAAM